MNEITKYSIIIVSYNAGDSLKKTVSSVLAQTYNNYEIIVKDGLSTDDSLSSISSLDKRIKIFCNKDYGIYSAMNQAISYASSDFVIFLNCGDYLYDDDVLKKIASETDDINAIYYGDCYTRNRGYVLKYPDIFNDYVCVTKTLCHQSTVYPLHLLKKMPFDEKFSINADFEYYVKAYCNGIKIRHMNIVVSNYEGGGTSETPKHRKESIKNSRDILIMHLGVKRYKKARIKAELHLFSLKQFLNSLMWFYPLYKKIATFYYTARNNLISK